MEGSAVVESFYATLGHEHGESLFDHLHDVQFYLKNRHGVYIRTNKAYTESYPLSQATLPSNSDQQLLPPFLAELLSLDDRKVLSGRPIAGRMRLVCNRRLSIDWLLVNMIPVHDIRRTVCGLAGMIRRCESVLGISEEVSEFAEVVHYICRHPDRPLRTNELAERCQLSVSAFERKFKRRFGMPPSRSLKQLRLSMACQLLLHSNDTISSIAQRAGFSDHSYLSKEFLRATGVPPGKFRERNQLHDL